MINQTTSIYKRFTRWIVANGPIFINRARQWYKQNPRRGCIVSVLILIPICFCCFTTYALIYNNTPQGRSAATERAGIKLIEALFTPTFTKTTAATNTPRPTNTQRLTNTPQPSYTSRPSDTPRPTKTPTQTLPPPPTTGFELVNITRETSPGGAALAQIRTQPVTSCNLTYTLPSGRLSTEDGLGEHTADKDGFCFWSWDIRSNTNPGTGTLTITAGGQMVNYSITIK